MFPSVHVPVDALRSLADEALREILYENAPFHTASQKELINNLFCERARRMQELDAEMERLTDAAASRLATEKDRILREYRVCSMAMNSPIRAVPADVLCEIFELCAERTPWRERPLFTTVSSLLLTTWICRKWRRIAHDMPWLWRELPLEWRMIDHRFAGPCVQEWLGRSKNVPVTYTIATQKNSKDLVARPRLMRETLGSRVVFPTLITRHLRLIGPAMDITLPLSNLPPDSFPMLVELHLNFLRDPEPTCTSFADARVVAFAESSALTALHLEGYIQEGVIEALPLSCITSLQLHLGSHTERSQSRNVLRRCSNLTHLRLQAEYAPRDPHDNGSPIILDKLETLGIHESAYEIWEVLSTPNLKTLEWIAGSCELNDYVCSFLERAPCLTSLTLVEAFIDDYTDIRDILCLLPRVQSLSLRRCSLRLGQMYSALTFRIGAERLVPELRSLVLKDIYSYQDSPSVDAFGTMMRSRRAMSDASPASRRMGFSRLCGTRRRCRQ